MTQEEKEKAMLADDLSAYINEKHTQEECIGFIDGYKSALSKLKKLRVADVIISVCEHEETENIHCEVGWSIEGKRCKKCKQTVL